MMKYLPMTVAVVLAMTLGNAARAQESKYPMMDQISQKVIKKYQTSSCTELLQQKSKPPKGQKAQAKQAIVQHLRKDPKLREEFINRVAGPIANRLFECGMIP
jgi:hypothetical protein